MKAGRAAPRVVIVGGGFAGVAAARRLARDRSVSITLIDRHGYLQFQPLLYQVATFQLGSADIAWPLRNLARQHRSVDVRLGDVISIDPAERTVTTRTGETYGADYLILSAGSQPNFFGTSGAAEHALPLYSLDDALRLRSRILSVFEEAARDPSLIERGALNVVIVGAGATGTEIAGAIAELITHAMRAEYRDLAVDRARVVVVDHGDAVLGPFTPKAHDYAAGVLTRDGVDVRLETGVTEVGPGHVVLSDGDRIPTRCVVWAGGLMAAPVAHASGLPVGHGGRIDVQSDLTVAGHPGVYVVGDIANIPSPGDGTFPQLGSVAQQSGVWAARNIEETIKGHDPRPFQYLDKGIMAMIGRGAAVAEMGARRHELEGQLAFVAWLGVHATLMSGMRNRIDAFVDWAWDYFSPTRPAQPLVRTDAARIDWGDDDEEPLEPPAVEETAAGLGGASRP